MMFCFRCKDAIAEEYLLCVLPSRRFHVTCLTCSTCGLDLSHSSTCFLRGGKTFCRNDYMRLLSYHCSKCDLVFDLNDSVMRANPNLIYHVDCFRCSTCSRALIGQKFLVSNGKLLCADWYFHSQSFFCERNKYGAAATSPTSACSVADVHGSVGDVTTRSSSGFDSCSLFSTNSDRVNFEDDGRPVAAQNGGHRRPRLNVRMTTRVRTILNEKQLHALRTCYSVNSRPDVETKEQLIRMTGLSSRVIRVWFQNRRCKDKKKQALIEKMKPQCDSVLIMTQSHY